MQTELVDVSSGTQLWGDQYKGKLDDILGLQEEIAQQVSQKLRLRLSGAEKTEISKHTTQNSEAYQLNLKGRYFWNKRTQEGLLKAIEYLNQASDRDPGYALAYAGLADSYLVQGWIGQLPPKEIYPKAREAATKALNINNPHLGAYKTSFRPRRITSGLTVIRPQFNWTPVFVRGAHENELQLAQARIAKLWFLETLSVPSLRFLPCSGDLSGRCLQRSFC
jgi:tetratricopeptide (TPR) repeat protein